MPSRKKTDPERKPSLAPGQARAFIHLLWEFSLIFSLMGMRRMKNIWTFENEKCGKMIIMEKKRTFYHTKNLRQRNSSPCAPAKKKAIRVSGWLFLMMFATPMMTIQSTLAFFPFDATILVTSLNDTYEREIQK